MAIEWITVDDLPDDLSGTEFAQEAVESASYLLWAMSGRKYHGSVTVSERYDLAPPLLDLRVVQTPLYIKDIRVIAATLPEVLPTKTRIRLRGTPAKRVVSVRRIRTGELISPDDYYLEEHSVLTFKKMLSEEVEVTYIYGEEPPSMGKMAARHLATEFAKLWGGFEDECSLPDRVTSVTRQGVTMTILDNQDFIQELRTGVYFIDLFLKTVNPAGARQRAKVFSPDIPRGKRTTKKPLVLPASTSDIIVKPMVPGELSLALSAVGSEYLSTETGWELEFYVRSWAESKFTLIPSAAVVSGSDIIVTVSYEEIYRTVGAYDPGTWDIYAVKNDDNVYVASGNISIQLS